MIWFTIKRLTQPLFTFLGKLKSRITVKPKKKSITVPVLFVKDQTRSQKILNRPESIPPEISSLKACEESKGEQSISIENRPLLSTQSPAFKLASGRSEKLKDIGRRRKTKSQSPEDSPASIDPFERSKSNDAKIAESVTFRVQQIIEGHSSSESHPIKNSPALVKRVKEVGEKNHEKIRVEGKVSTDLEKTIGEPEERKAEFDTKTKITSFSNFEGNNMNLKEIIDRSERKWNELNQKTEEIQGKLLKAQEILRKLKRRKIAA